MLDIKFIRENPDMVTKALKTRGAVLDSKKLLALDEGRRKKIQEVDELRARQNILSEEIAKAGAGERDVKIAESKELKTHLVEAEAQLKIAEEEFGIVMRALPNIPKEGWLVGKDEHENAVLREVAASGEPRPAGRGEKRDFKFTPQDYMAIAEKLDLIDTERAAKVSGSRFGYLKNEAVLLEMALVQFAFAHLAKKGFVPVVPPVLIKEEMMRGMGYVDSEKDKEERYFLEKDNMYLVGTSEQSIGPMHADEILNEDALPKRYAGFSTCFRREAGSYGKDTHGILRVHQFDKVEMFIFSRPEDSKKEHELMLALEEELMQSLGLPYRVVQLCTGDLSQPSAGTYDIEAWLPGQNKGEGQYRETHSTSNTTDYQARRLNVKIRRKDGTTEFAHLLNGTAFAIGRMIIAILENYQQDDGSVNIPEALQPYMGGMKRLA
ncbi:MAG: serine--tRNA ligase [bacterium]|nr:serine--tRNA ligase [bacterium]